MNNKFYIFAGEEARIPIKDLTRGGNSVLQAGLTIDARLVSRDRQPITAWISQTDSTNGNDWSAQTFIAVFAAGDTVNAARQPDAILLIRVAGEGVWRVCDIEIDAVAA